MRKGVSVTIAALLIFGLVLAAGVVFYIRPKFEGFTLSGYPTAINFGEAFSVTVTAIDQFGKPYPNYKGSIHFTSTDINAIIPEPGTQNNPYVFDGSENGVQLFEGFKLVSGDSTTITVSDEVKSKSTDPIIVSSPPVLDHFEFSSISKSQTVGDDFDVIVTAIDQHGNTLTGYSGTPVLTYSAGSINPPTISSWSNGIGTATVSVQNTGIDVTIMITDNQAVGTSNPFNVNPASELTLTLEVTEDVRVDMGFSITVTAKDQLGNIATDYSGRVHFSSNDEHALLPGDYKFKSDDNGVQTFFPVSIRSVTNWTITATDILEPSITGCISGTARPETIDFVPGPPGSAIHDWQGFHIPYPDHVIANDLILLQIVGDVSYHPNLPQGFSLLYGPDVVGPVHQYIFYKFANGTEGNKQQWIPYIGQCSKAALMFVFRNVELSNFTEGGGFVSGYGDSILAPSVTTTSSDRLALSFVFSGLKGDNNYGFIGTGHFAGETGGDWTSPWVGHSMSFATTAWLGIAITTNWQWAEMYNSGIISGGNATLTQPTNWGVRAFALIPRAP